MVDNHALNNLLFTQGSKSTNDNKIETVVVVH